jgi:hypothetical protein
MTATDADIGQLVSFDGVWKDTTDVLEASSLDDLDDDNTNTNVYLNRSSGYCM